MRRRAFSGGCSDETAREGKPVFGDGLRRQEGRALYAPVVHAGRRDRLMRSRHAGGRVCAVPVLRDRRRQDRFRYPRRQIGCAEKRRPFGDGFSRVPYKGLAGRRPSRIRRRSGAARRIAGWTATGCVSAAKRGCFRPASSCRTGKPRKMRNQSASDEVGFVRRFPKTVYKPAVDLAQKRWLLRFLRSFATMGTA